MYVSLILFAIVAIAQTTTSPTIANTETETYWPVELDPSSCDTKDLKSLLNPPRPTGALLEAMTTHAESVLAKCEATRKWGMCSTLWYFEWCAVSTAAPSSALTDYNAYGSSVSSWWSLHTRDIWSAQSECPYLWDHGLWASDIQNAWMWQDLTRAIARCYADPTLRQGFPSPTVEASSAMPGSGAVGPTATAAASRGIDLSATAVGMAVAALVA